ncbi:MAG: hypothetical protein ACRED8_04920, partial [Caulobacteraceae bacterium]
MSLAGRLGQALDAEIVETGEARLSARRHDQWAASAIADHLGGGAPSPACVVRPRRVEDVQ